jgi:transposase-like protein
MSTKKKQRNKGRKKARTAPAYPFEFRLRVVRLHLEDGYEATLLAQEFNISEYSVYRWSKAYREQGVDGRDKVSQKWSFKNEPPGRGSEFSGMGEDFNSESNRRPA